VQKHIRYHSFGRIIQQTGTLSNRFWYTGREWDGEIGLYFYRARYYDPLVGRFIGEDPIGFGAGDINLYRYVGNQPINFIDSFGLQSRSRYPLGHNNPECIDLAETIKNISEDIAKRISELHENPQNLPGTYPNDKQKPRLSQRGHSNEISRLKAVRAGHIANYQSRCGDWPPPDNQCQPEDKPKHVPENNSPFQLPELQWPDIQIPWPFPLPIPGRDPGGVFF
jgi:RHS repeat-associated protein